MNVLTAVVALVVGVVIGWALRKRYDRNTFEAVRQIEESQTQRVKCPFCPLYFTKRGMGNHCRKAHPENYRKSEMVKEQS